MLACAFAIQALILVAAAPALAFVIEDSVFTQRLVLVGHQLDGVVIRDCTFTGVSGTGIEITNVANGSIENCTFVNVARSAIWLRDDAHTWTIRNCTFTNIGRNGVLADETAPDLLIEQCEFTDVATDSTGDKRHGVYIQAPGYRIQNNTFTRIHDGNAISLRSTGVASGNVVSNVGLLGAQSDAIKYFPSSAADPAQPVVIENNIVWDPSKHGIELDAEPADSLNFAHQFVIRFNTAIIHDGPHVLHPKPLGIDVDVDLANESVSVYGNLVVNEVEGFNDTSDAPPNADVALDNRVFAANPGFFVDWDGKNFHILNNPLVVDAAVSSPAFPAADLDGNVRPLGNAADIGADELGVFVNVLLPVHDTYVHGGSMSGVNYDGVGLLRVRNAVGNDNDQHSYLQFDLSSIAHPVLNSSLVLFLEGLPNGGPAAAHVYATGDAWDETTLTWNTQPATGNLLAARADLGATGPYSFDVTAAASSEASGDGVLSLMLRDDTGTGLTADFDQREDSNPPKLIVLSFPALQANLTFSVTGQGQIQTSPPGLAHVIGTPVALAGLGAPNWTFSGWGGALSGTTNPESLTVTGDLTVVASFAPIGPGDFRQYGLDAVPVASATNGGNSPVFVTDDLLSTRWEAVGDGQWIRFDLGVVETISALSIAWHLGDQRRYDFDVEVSTDAVGWAPALVTNANSGNTADREIYDLVDVTARYVRIIGHGNNVDASTAITEVALLRPVDPITSVDDAVPAVRTGLRPNFPNPFNPATTIRYDIGRAGHVRLDVYDVAGRRVTTLLNGVQARGHHEIAWRALDRDGRRVPSGVYYLRLQMDDQTHSLKLTVLQ